MTRLQRFLTVGIVLAGIVVAVGFIAHRSPPTPAPPADTPPLPQIPAHSSPAWLGLDYNSGAGIGKLDAFAARGIVYDREGGLEVLAGATAQPGSSLGQALSRSYGAGMIPDVELDPRVGTLGCEGDPQPEKLCLPTSVRDVSAYVSGFMQTALSVRRWFPRRRVLFEPMNEPWDWASPAGTESGERAAREYGAMLARLLATAHRVHLRLADIYVPATGTLSDGTSWVPDLYAADPCLRPGNGSCGPIEGWSVHPYGLPGLTQQGIDSVPILHRELLSGRSNVVVSEIGFCADDVARGSACSGNLPNIEGSSGEAAHWLSETLRAAAKMHQQGWLKALLVWQRGGGGWAMQNANGTLTAQGRALDLFADSQLER